MQIHPKLRVFLLVIGFVLLLIAPVTYAVYQEYKARTTQKNRPAATTPAPDSVNNAH